MARARNIKPGLLKNELLGTEDPLITILFVSLWMIADREGRLEDRPLRIKAETFPYRENIDINGYLTVLERLGFIHRYEVNGLRLIQIDNFKKHQSPHNTEKASELPSIENRTDKNTINSDGCDLTVKQPLFNGELTEAKRPDSLIHGFTDSLIPDSQDSCSEPKVSKPKSIDDSPIVISIPTNKFNTEGEERPITENKIKEWQAVYPAVDVKQTIFRIRSWVVNNPNKRKTFSGIYKFIDHWLAKEQSSGGSNAPSQPPNRPGGSPAKVPHADAVRGQAQRAFERINGVNGAGAVRQNGSVVSQQSQGGRVAYLP